MCTLCSQCCVTVWCVHFELCVYGEWCDYVRCLHCGMCVWCWVTVFLLLDEVLYSDGCWVECSIETVVGLHTLY